MKNIGFYVVMILLLAVASFSGFSLGVHATTDGIEATCKDVNGVTVLNGTGYVCLTAQQWNNIVARIQQRGS